MDFDEFLQQVRNHYLIFYRDAVRRYQEQHQPGGPEVLMERSGEQADEYRLYRVDLASGAMEPPDLTEVNPSKHLEFEPIEAKTGELHLFLEPFVWNGVEFDCSPSIEDDGNLRQWALRWIDPQETAESDEYGLGNYIHSVTEPEQREGDITSFSVDFGSAATDSWFELLDVLKAYGVHKVSIHSRQVLGDKQ